MTAAAGLFALDGDSRPALAGPLTPRMAVEAYFATTGTFDGESRWELMCRAEQQKLGSRQAYLRSIAELRRTHPDPYAPDSHVIGMRSADPAEGDGFAVTLALTGGGGSGWVGEVLVVWERGGFRVCGVL
ncbi:hypothetical protein [Trujillonella humicola]|uniref:hypothetical protein n=1 Tax=Trujillonella humicola TaxID=3383699 RepID=UPI003905DD26